MRLWHQKIISHLPRQQLLGQHRECAALRGRGWGRPHSVINYVFTHSTSALVAYHYLIMDEMERRGYHPDSTWRDPNYRGTALGIQSGWANPEGVKNYLSSTLISGEPIYLEHNDKYLQECLDNLKEKGIEIEL